MSKSKLGFLVLICSIFACSYPVRQVSNSESSPSILVEGAAVGDQLVVDSKMIGNAIEFSGNPKVLRVSSGSHRVQIMDSSGKVKHDEKIFIDSDVRKVRVGELK